MPKFDESQQQVLALSPHSHACVLGAPGSGKTLLLIESFARVAGLPGWSEDQILILASNRLVGAELRRRVEQRLEKAMGGTPVRTAPALAFAILQQAAAKGGLNAPRLLTGTAHDEALESVIEEGLAEGTLSDATRLLVPEVLRSEVFRAELRELDRVLDDFSLTPAELTAMLHSGSSPVPPTVESVQQWQAGLPLLHAVRERLAADRPNELTASGMIRAACEVIREESAVALPRLVLVDDASDLGEGALALLAALADRGSKIWVFGDPDIATGSFSGERARVLGGLEAELSRRIHYPVDVRIAGTGTGAENAGVSGATSGDGGGGVSAGTGEAVRDDILGSEQSVVLSTVYRHGAEIRRLVRSLSERIGAAGAGQQRRAATAELVTAEPGKATPAASKGSDEAESAGMTRIKAVHSVQFAVVPSQAEQLGVVAHRLRAAHLGLAGTTPLPWSRMAVICRSRAEVKRVSRLLAGQQVPSGVAAGGLVLREHQLVRELIRLLQHALGIATLTAREVSELLTGTIGGLDPIGLRRLRGALRVQAVREGEPERASMLADELLLEAFQFPGERPVIDSRGGRQLRRLGLLAVAGAKTFAQGGTPREVLWQIWDGSRLASDLQSQALDLKGQRSDEAHRALDAVVGLFFALQRHEEQDSERPIAVLLEDLLVNTVPEDSLAARSERDVVTVTTPQGVIGKEFDLVCVLGLQDGVWPNLRSRGSLLGVSALERWLRGEEALPPSRRDTMHDELRLLTHTVARSRQQLLVVAVLSEDQHPSPFFSLGKTYLVERSLPSSRLTLRGAVAEMRRRLVMDPNDTEALNALVELVRAGVPGAAPDEWYGVAQPSSTEPLADIDADPDVIVNVSPSQMERAEECPLNWITQRLGGGVQTYQASIGTILHHALETAGPGVTAEDLLELVTAQWGSLRFDAEWQSQRALNETASMAEAIASYLARFERSDQSLLAGEAHFELPLGFARLRGSADRIEQSTLEDGTIEITVVDLKTGKRPPSAKELEQHAQLQAYQLGVLRGAFKDSDGNPIASVKSSGARLVYVHPGSLNATQKKRGEKYLEIEQAGLDKPAQQMFEERVREVAKVMAGANFTAQVEHHCTSQYKSGACSIQIVPAVSHA